MKDPLWHYTGLGAIHTACGLSRAFRFGTNNVSDVTCPDCHNSDEVLALRMERALDPSWATFTCVVDDGSTPGVPIPDETTKPNYPKVRPH